ncbi:flagellin [Filomicrobium sp.]|uniref:flagellin n=1 Tax=Filomicrobium sp. TaxID=2024831 RepID=UPI00258FFEDB|nr:flagellin [Filomicrobium sp.]
MITSVSTSNFARISLAALQCRSRASTFRASRTRILSNYLKAVDSALYEITLSASVVGAAKSRVEANKDFVKNLIDANNRGIGQLVDADLNEESAKLKALQVQEQLAIQALGIANSSSQNILRLFD